MSLNSATHYELRWPNTIASDPRVIALEPEVVRFASDDSTDAARWLLNG